jgi:hypothetical protein
LRQPGEEINRAPSRMGHFGITAILGASRTPTFRRVPITILVCLYQEKEEWTLNF